MGNFHRRVRNSNLRWVVAVLSALALTAAACGGDDADSESSDTSDDGGAPQDESDGESDDASDSGDGTATVTMGDGTVYNFTMSTCDTNETAPERIIVDQGYDLRGKSDDGFEFTSARVGFEESDVVTITTLEGGFDENGGNAAVTYTFVEDPGFTVDGGNVNGTVTLRNSFTDQIHGETSEATVEVSC